MSETRTISAVQAKKAINKAFETKRPVFLWGPPGIGKSDVVRQVTEDLGGLMIDLRLSQMEPTDLRGIPFYNKDKGVMDWAPPIDLPDEELAAQYPVIVLFFDELNSGAPSVQAASYQLFLDRRIGRYKLPANVVMLAAGNRESDKGVTYRMPSPLANRFIHLEMAPNFDAWEIWALDNGIHKDVVAYLTFAKQDLYDFDSRSASRSFATPRAWSFVSDILKDENIDDDTLINLVSGTIGEGLALKFMAHRKIASQLPIAADVLSGKVTDLAIKDVSAQYSLAISMLYDLKNSHDTDREVFGGQFTHFLKFILKNFETELGVMASRIAFNTYKFDAMLLLKGDLFDEYHNRFGKYILGSHQNRDDKKTRRSSK